MDVPVSFLTDLDKLARSTDRTKSFLASRAIEEFVAAQEWQVQAIEEAVRQADAPGARFIEHDAVASKVRRTAITSGERKTG